MENRHKLFIFGLVCMVAGNLFGRMGNSAVELIIVFICSFVIMWFAYGIPLAEDLVIEKGKKKEKKPKNIEEYIDNLNKEDEERKDSGIP